MSSWQTVTEALLKAKRISVVIAQKIDGDAIGSALAIKELERKGKSVEIVCQMALPTVFGELAADVQLTNKINPQVDLIVLVDISQLKQTGLAQEISQLKKLGKKVIAIDHHPQSNLAVVAEPFLHQVDFASTTEILCRCFALMRQPISPQLANYLLLGIYTDTKGFKNPNTSAQTLSIVAKLIRQGADLNKIGQLFRPHRQLAAMRLWGEIFTNLEVNDLGIAAVLINRQILAKTRASDKEAAGLANELAATEGIKLAAVFLETSEGWRVSLRTKCRNIQLERLASIFNGRANAKAGGFLATKELFPRKEEL